MYGSSTDVTGSVAHMFETMSEGKLKAPTSKGKIVTVSAVRRRRGPGR